MSNPYDFSFRVPNGEIVFSHTDTFLPSHDIQGSSMQLRRSALRWFKFPIRGMVRCLMVIALVKPDGYPV